MQLGTSQALRLERGWRTSLGMAQPKTIERFWKHKSYERKSGCLRDSSLAAVGGRRKKAYAYKECFSGIDLEKRTTGPEDLK